ncbi:4'-phosphopantetheinyl transferase family protein [Flavobacterium sp.]|uniref:4'-phosphopantetheinyl transferase family protein n=1 Tax=Flavobacterium sp. TaxID=239 RepID=UPI003D12F269
MPFYKEIQFSPTTTVYLWKITEDYNELFRSVSLKDTSLARLEKMRSESHQKGFLAVRMLLQHCGYTDFDLEYDATGKPNLKSEIRNQKSEINSLHISISHSAEFSAIALSSEPIGIDLEKAKEKVLRIAPRFMHMTHLEQLSQEEQIQKATVIWGVKEAIFKIKNEVGISFPDHIFEDAFHLEDKKCKAQLRFNHQTEDFNICFEIVEDYVLVCGSKAL